MGYKYDVFISYSGDTYGPWVNEIFFKPFKGYLSESLGKKSEIFIDKRSIDNGAAWPECIKHSIAKSKCLVAILSPLYFRSEWCRKEYSVMLYREEKLGYLSSSNPKGLICSASVHDGEKFPSIIKSIQRCEWHEYAHPYCLKAFELTQTFAYFHTELKHFADCVAKVVESAPPYQDLWLTEEWMTSAINKYFNSLLVTESYEQPVL